MPFLHQVAEIKHLATDHTTDTIPPLIRIIQECQSHQEKLDTPLDEKHTAHRMEVELKEDATNSLTIAEAEAFAFSGNHTAKDTGTSIVAVKRHDEDEDDDIKRICQQTWAHALADTMTKIFGCNVYAVRRYSDIEWTFYGNPVSTRQAAQTFEIIHAVIQQEAWQYHRDDVESCCLGVVNELLDTATRIKDRIRAGQNIEGLQEVGEVTTDEHEVNRPTLFSEDNNHDIVPTTDSTVFNPLWLWLQDRLSSVLRIPSIFSQLIAVSKLNGDINHGTNPNPTPPPPSNAANIPHNHPTISPNPTPSISTPQPNHNLEHNIQECTIPLITTFTTSRKRKINVTNTFQEELDRYKPKRRTLQRTVKITNAAAFEEGRNLAKRMRLKRFRDMYLDCASE